jgi:hypothetical protein
MSAKKMKQLSIEQEQAIVAWACRQDDRFAGLDTAHITVRLVGRLEGGKTGVIEATVAKEQAIQVVQASASLTMTELQDIVADATHFMERPIVMVSSDGVGQFDA